MTKLTASELLKYSRRTELFITKIKEHSPFEITNGDMVNLLGSDIVINSLSSGDRKTLNKLRIQDTNGNTYKLSDFVKTKEFGGKGAGSGTIKENQALLSFRNKLNVIKSTIGQSSVPIMIGDTIHYTHDVVSTPGTPKSDFHLVDETGLELIWISHKDGHKAKDHQQWGGMSKRNEPLIHNTEETQQFISYIKSEFPKGLPNATTIARKITDDHLKKISIYGNQYGNEFGRQNVNLVLQGDISLIDCGNHYQLTATHIHHNGDDMVDDYEPVFMAIYKGDRNDCGIKNTRMVIAPVGSRKITYFS